MPLPTAFCERMNALLGAEAGDFFASLDRPRAHGLRLNTLRCAPQDNPAHRYFSLEPVPWCPDGYYYPPTDKPGKHPLYEAGLYYIQEPSAMAVGALAAPQPGEWVLDLCAAPGGKTSHLAQTAGFVLANEIHPARAKVLAQTVERMGLVNVAVTNEGPERLAKRLPEAFDCVVVDAPCSGEGMFRKDMGAADEWDPDAPSRCADRQDTILAQAAELVRPGGRLVYSTCTFAPEENEGTVSRFLAQHPGFHIRPAAGYPWFSPGRPDWVEGVGEELRDCLRLWPHKLRGEGHFCAVLVREGEGPRMQPPLQRTEPLPPPAATFWADVFPGIAAPESAVYGDRVWLYPSAQPALDGLKVVRAGVEAGTLKKGRFEPAHALALACDPRTACRRLALRADEQAAVRYLCGETLPTQGENGWTLVCADGFALGWGKAVDGVVKNHYPKGLRKTPRLLCIE